MQFLLCDFIARKILAFDRNNKSGSHTLDCTQQSIDQGSSTVGLSHWLVVVLFCFILFCFSVYRMRVVTGRCSLLLGPATLMSSSNCMR